jgi:threonine/homoserine/homoserine lactone efflux protein
MKIKAFVFVGVITLFVGFILDSSSLKIPLYFLGSLILFYSGIEQLKKARRLHNEFKAVERK